MYGSTLKTYTISDSPTLIGGGEVQYNSIGTNIRKFRTEKNLRQEDLAERAGLSANYIVKSSLLNDKLRNLSKHDREKIFAVIETMIKHS
mgnify:CR=1 FL=1